MVTLIHKNLFTSSHSLAHCVSEDFAMGAGIAVQFKKMWGNEILSVVGSRIIKFPCCVPVQIGDRYIFNLVTKKYYNYFPTYNTLKKALIEMFEFAQANHIDTIAMPKIAAGLDRLDWSRVQIILEDLAVQHMVNIEVYYL